MWSDDEEEAATDEVINQVLDEIGISLEGQLGGVATPTTTLAAAPEPAPQKAAVEADADRELLDRLNNLRRQDS